MKLEDTPMRVTLGLALRMFLNNVIENGPVPLLIVASVFPSGESAIPYGFGACTLSSVPTGVIRRPFGKTAPLIPPMLTVRLAGRWPAGALKVIAFEPPVPGPPWPPATWIMVGRTMARATGSTIATAEEIRRM